MSNIVRYTPPFPSFPSLFNDDFFGLSDVFLDRMMAKAFPDIIGVLGNNIFESGAYPKVDVRETEREFIIEAEILGLAKNQVKVEVKDDTLILRGDKRSEEKREGKYHVKEIKRSSFIRSWDLPPDLVDKTTVRAKFQDGFLEVKVNKKVPIPLPKPDVKVIDIEDENTSKIRN